jgi:predicted nicotinamide N-methyase
MTLILFTLTAPHPFAEELSRQGYRVFEAVAISEVYALADQHMNASIIITADVDPERVRAVQHHYTTLHLKTEATIMSSKLSALKLKILSQSIE